MKRKRMALRGWLVLTVAVVMFGSAGCSSVGEYLQYRYEDFTEMADVGLTITPTPQWGFYWNSLEAFPLGVSHIDGYFVGFGGGQFLGLGTGNFGYVRHYNRCWGLGYGEEIIGWGPELGEVGTVDEENSKVLIKRRSGFIGIITGILGVDVTDSGYGLSPNYTPACVHFFPHIAYVGFVWNARYMEMVDFMLGWFFLDIAGDDGYAVGKWSFPRRMEEDEPTETAAVDLSRWD